MKYNSLMYKVEYLILVSNDNTVCNTVVALKHLVQSDSNIVINSGKNQIRYKNKLDLDFVIIKGSASCNNPDDEDAIYFDITFICKHKKDLEQFSCFLKSIRKVIYPILASSTALQVLWDDVSTNYAQSAYPLISYTENLMRKLITKFMHINVGLSWPEERVPDDVQKNIKSSNSDTTYLYNVDFIGLKDILLSEKYSKDRDALLKELKNSEKNYFKKDEINSLIPTSNWEKYFSKQVSCDATELEKLWSNLYELRCQVAHNKSFTRSDLDDCIRISKRLNIIINDAIEKLDEIHIDKEEAEDIVMEIAANVSKLDKQVKVQFIDESRKLNRYVYLLTTPFQPKNSKASSPRMFSRDLKILKDLSMIDSKQYSKIQTFVNLRNKVTHKIDDSIDIENLNELIIDMQKISLVLQSYIDSEILQQES